MLCIIQSSAFSRDHIIAIAHNWIFDSNLPYAIPLNEKSLNWCASHGKPGICYVTCVEQVQVGKKRKGNAKKGNKKYWIVDQKTKDKKDTNSITDEGLDSGKNYM